MTRTCGRDRHARRRWRMPGEVIDDIKAGYDGFLLHPGDLGYAMGTGFVWDIWMEQIEGISRFGSL